MCGVLAVEIGRGSGPYHHQQGCVHGLWPQVPPYGDSECAPSGAEPTHMPSCYTDWNFVQHEWFKHGVCAGAQDGDSFFDQVCKLAKEPLELIDLGLKKGLSDEAIAQTLRDTFPVVDMDPKTDQITIAACLAGDQWKLVAPEHFEEQC